MKNWFEDYRYYMVKVVKDILPDRIDPRGAAEVTWGFIVIMTTIIPFIYLLVWLMPLTPNN